MRIRTLACVAALVAGVAPLMSHAATPAPGYLAVDGVAPPAAPSATSGGGWSPAVGAGTDASWMNILAYTLTESASGSSQASGAGAGKSVGSVTITRYQDQWSPLLMVKANAGAQLPQAILDVQAANGTQMIYKLGKVTLSRYTVSGGSAGAQEQFTMTYGQYQVLDVSAQPLVNGVALHIPPLVAAARPAPPPPQAPLTHTVTTTIHSPWAN